MTIGERIRIVRSKTLGRKISMASFADKIGVTSGAVSQWENNQKTPSNSVIVLICKEFGINEEWLRNGTGDMFTISGREVEVARIADVMLNDVDPYLKTKLIRMVADAPAEDLELFAKYAREFVASLDEKETPAD